MKISLPNSFYDLQAPQIFIYSKTDIGGTIPLTNPILKKSVLQMGERRRSSAIKESFFILHLSNKTSSYSCLKIFFSTTNLQRSTKPPTQTQQAKHCLAFKMFQKVILTSTKILGKKQSSTQLVTQNVLIPLQNLHSAFSVTVFHSAYFM